ncbi:hypothetical protein LPJ73_000593 [Coemansia sp. RSA 2703]|nr:hypothetical protein LPJ73_000593 [Coemansia sp. RSA 2703]KAJ2378015.1 hypothetical protein IW150_001054 [Coemansia sp. RSA 2607]KAJ2398129.1 hypothetical protein GGI05_000276 [Coemansia sp. RSA 2603]
MHRSSTSETTRANREEVLQLIVQQLSAYGYPDLSKTVVSQTRVAAPAESSSSRLSELVASGLRNEQQQQQSSQIHIERRGSERCADDALQGIDLKRKSIASVPHYKVWYKTMHKGAATVAAFSTDGQYIATGSVDTSLKLIEVDRVQNPASGTARREDKPVIRTLYNHEAEITGLDFHPNGLVLASCSTDHTIKLFDLSAAYGKFAFQSMRDNYAYRAISFHPSGEYLAAATDTNEVRMYNVRTSSAYLLREGAGSGCSQHSSGLTHVSYARSGALVASASQDGCVKLWDGRSGTCVRTLDRVHEGRTATSAIFTRSSKYLLTTGLDSTVRLWDVASGRLINKYEGAAIDAANAQAVFSHDESLVMIPDARSNSIAFWDAASAKSLRNSAVHQARITHIATSPTTAAFMSCSVDDNVRYWGCP